MKDILLKKKEEEVPTTKEDEKNSLSKIQEKFLLEKRVVFLFDEVNEESAKKVVHELLLLDFEKPQTPIRFFINSPGGTITDGLSIYDTMQAISSPIHTICLGLAASMGSLLLSGGEKKNRYILPHAEVMIHQPLLSGSYRAVSRDLEIEAIQLEKTKNKIATILTKNTGNTMAKILKDMDRNFWLTAEEAVNYGLVDKMITKFS